ncbi:uncharacterized protein LOC111701047 [Eurytemora carolleeae]|uniref:uncharacterized protein LOC111701047 n=1 Tax=Eurytemora carolleeae TaxID=1294199 RepID=UPI000C7873D9|nr:uncharacterized protein LOC111701047 [Eurytemora carolleeae]|eukprot:XP_023327931.1 uncharacterized protein LOC111701047 [Eurytemora affinis]
MLVDQTMCYENYPCLNYEISSEDQAGVLPYLNLEEWVEGVECREPVNLKRNSFLLHTQNINTIKSIKVIKQNIMVLTQNNQLFSINTQFKTVTHISRCSDNPCYVVDNGSVMCSVSHRVLNIFYNTAHNHDRICRLNCEEFENICSPLVSLNSTSVIGTSRGGHLVEIFDFWNTNCDTECQH